MINAIPFIGWAIDIFVSMSISVPFWFIWNRLAPIYFYWLPQVYLHIPFWHCVGLFIIIPILKQTLIPKLVSVENTAKSK
jgi:hypothetical protein